MAEENRMKDIRKIKKVDKNGNIIKARPKAEKRYSLLIIFNDGSELYKYYSHSTLVISNLGRSFRKEFGADIKQMFVFDNAFEVRVKELKQKNCIER